MSYIDAVNPFSRDIIFGWEQIPHADVYIDQAKLRKAARQLGEAPLPESVEEGFERGLDPSDPHVFVTHHFWRSVLNFCFSHPYVDRVFSTHDVSGKLRSGSWALYACFYRRFGEKPVLADDILSIVESLQATKRFFSGKHAIPLAGERRALLEEAATVLKGRFNGDPRNLIEEGRYRAFGTRDRLGIVEILVFYFPTAFGQDSASVSCAGKQCTFRFMKRAQLFVMLYHARALVSNGALHPIGDIRSVGPMLDYELPRNYRAEGIFRYSDELEDMIACRSPIPRHSRKEIELRLATAWAFAHELELANEIRAARKLPPVTGPELDWVRWMRGQAAPINHHITLTTDY